MMPDSVSPRSLLLALALIAGFYAIQPVRAATVPLPPMLPPMPPPVMPAPAVPPTLPPVVLGAQFPQGMRIQEFARVVLVDVLRSQFIFSSEFLLSQAQIGFSARDLKKAGTESLLRDVLAEHGFSLEFRGGYYHVSPTRSLEKPDLREDFVYRLKNRDLSYISSQIQPLFPQGSFTYQRSIDTTSQQTSSTTQTGGGASAGRPVDSGGSLYSASSRVDSDILFFRGVPADIARLKAVLAAIDTRVPTVVVRAFVLETASSNQAGFSVSAVAKLLGSRLGVSIGASTASTGGAGLTFSSSSFEAVASVLQSESSVRVLTSPSIFAENGVQSSVVVGNSVPVLGAIQTATNGQTSQSVTNVDTGVILRITPHIYEESIGIELQQELSDAIQTETGVKGSPTITKRSIQTRLNMRSGQWVVLGGVSSSKVSGTRDSIPFFKLLSLGRTKSQSASDIVIVLYLEKS